MRLQSFVAGAVALALAVAAVGLTAQAPSSKLRNPLALIEEAPATFKANFDTSKGTFVIEVTATGRRSGRTASTTS